MFPPELFDRDGTSTLNHKVQTHPFPLYRYINLFTSGSH